MRPNHEVRHFHHERGAAAAPGRLLRVTAWLEEDPDLRASRI
jgi:hypothetical protein